MGDAVESTPRRGLFGQPVEVYSRAFGRHWDGDETAGDWFTADETSEKSECAGAHSGTHGPAASPVPQRTTSVGNRSWTPYWGVSGSRFDWKPFPATGVPRKSSWICVTRLELFPALRRCSPPFSEVVRHVHPHSADRPAA